MHIITRATLIGCSVVAFHSAALAADFGTRRAAPSPAFTPERVQNWSGGYIGVHGGLEVDAFKSVSASPNIPALNFSGKKNTKGLGGGSLGLQAGYNWQSGNVVYGVEAEGSGLFLSSKKSAGDLKPDASSRLAAKGRLGYSFGSTLLYGTAGLALSPQRITSPAVGVNPAARKSLTRVGPLLGLGVEHKITQNVSLRAEVDYALQGERRMVFPAGTTKVQSGAISAKAGLNWHF